MTTLTPRALASLILAMAAALSSGCATPPGHAAGSGNPPGNTPGPGTASSPSSNAPTDPLALLESQPPHAGEPVAALAVATDPLRPGARIDPNDAEAQLDLWGRIRQGFTMPDLDDDTVRKSEQWYATRPDYVARMTERGSRYLFHIVEEVQKRGMPTELALLPFIESAFNPQAMSVAKASGMWQFIPSTGKDYELKQNLFRDDRRDVLASTRAALDHLGRLHDMFGDWQLALAAYNWGEGNVQRAVARNEKAGLPADYASLRMPDETRWYLPKLQAVKNIVAKPENFALSLPPLENHPYFLSVAIERDIDVTLAARLADLPIDEFKALNPQMNRPVILAAGTPHVLLPYDNANQFVRAVPLHHGAFASWTAWVAPRTMHPAEAARQTGMSEGALREVNHIPPKMLVKGGSTLLVARAAHDQADVSEHLADNAMLQLAPDVPPLRRVAFKAPKRGTTVAAVAQQYRVTAEKVASWNGVAASGRFHAGQSIVVFVPAMAKGTRRLAAAKPTANGQRKVAAAGSSHAAGRRIAAKVATARLK